MESSPTTIETGSDDDDSSTKKKSRRAERLGAIVVEPKAEESTANISEDDNHETFWQRLTKRGEDGREEHETGDVELPDGLPELEAGADPEEFTDIDRQFAEGELAGAHRRALQQELSGEHLDAESASAIEAELLALEAFYDKIIEDHAPIDEAFAETVHDMGVPAEAVQAAETTRQEGDVRTSDEGPDGPLSWTHFGGENVPPATEQALEAPEDLIDDGGDVPGVGGSGSVPPGFPPQGMGGGHVPRPPEPAAVGGEAAPASPAPAAEDGEPRYTRANVIGAALVGGIVGYLIGRRRGRIKTEKKLLPVQKKLEKEVSALEGEMFKKETALKKMARERQYQQQSMDKLRRRNVRQEEQLAAEALPEPSAAMTKHAFERMRAPAFEANQLHGKKAHEKIGKVLMSAERPTASSEPASKAGAENRLASRKSETMSRRELMEMSEKISVNNTNLRRIYESRLVGERGLRRLVEAHMHGGDVSRVLQQEMLEHQIDFERDPVMRDHRPQQDVINRTDGASLNSLLDRAGLSAREGHEDQEVLQARAAHHEVETQKARQRRRAVDMAFGGTILVLIAIILLLLFTH